MKKLLFLLAGLLFSILPSSAQQKIADITTTIVTTPDELTSGYYIINCYIPKTSETKPSGSLYYNSDRADRPFCITRDGFIFNQETQITSDKANYIWYVNKTDDGNITIRNIYPKVYFPTDVNRNENMGNPEKKAAEVFAIKSKSVTDNEGTDMSGIVLTATSKKDTENDQEYERTVFANWETGTDPNLSYWSTGDGEIMFQFVAVQNVNFKITTSK